jgi:hypothetical protein
VPRLYDESEFAAKIRLDERIVIGSIESRTTRLEIELENCVEFRESAVQGGEQEKQEDFTVIRSDSLCVEVRCQDTTSGD